MRGWWSDGDGGAGAGRWSRRFGRERRHRERQRVRRGLGRRRVIGDGGVVRGDLALAQLTHFGDVVVDLLGSGRELPEFGELVGQGREL